jgi:hypothetical protein
LLTIGGMLRCCIAEASSSFDVIGAMLTAEGMVERLTHSGRFDTAIRVACSLEIDMTTIFSRLAQACLLLSKRVPTVLYVTRETSRTPPDYLPPQH